jgi:hypothetical protein
MKETKKIGYVCDFRKTDKSKQSPNLVTLTRGATATKLTKSKNISVVKKQQQNVRMLSLGTPAVA